MGWRRTSLSVALSVLAFAIYAAGVVSLRQDKLSNWVIEPEFSLPAAVSYAALGRPLGYIDSNVQAIFKDTSERAENRISVQDAMARSIRPCPVIFPS